LFPEHWQEEAVRSGAVERLRGFDSPEALLRTLLLHVGSGYSLRETVVHAKLAGIADVSDVALLKRLRNAEEWLRQLCLHLLRESGMHLAQSSSGRRIRVVDGTIVREPGKTGSQWRLLYCLGLPSLECDFFELTAAEGAGTGETLTRLPLTPNDIVLADAGYCTSAGIWHVVRNEADLVVRINPQTFTLCSASGEKQHLLTQLKQLQQAGTVGDWPAWIRTGSGELVAGRVCALRKSERAIEQAHRRLRKNAAKKQHQLQPKTLELACYVAVFTTCKNIAAAEILDWYRSRWQIELVFKRLKSLAQLGHLPKHDERSSRAWLHGKLLVSLLAHKLIRIGRDISPWGYIQTSQQ
jgi:hypothetical protein